MKEVEGRVGTLKIGEAANTSWLMRCAAATALEKGEGRKSELQVVLVLLGKVNCNPRTYYEQLSDAAS